MKPQKYAFLDRDGALIFEPQDTFQVDTISQLQILPGVIEGLQKLKADGYLLVMVTNQDGIGSSRYPKENFDAVQKALLETFAKNGIEFEAIYVCPHFLEENCTCRKPKIGMADALIKSGAVDCANSIMYGDRETDRQFAKNIGVKFFKATTNGPFTIF